MSEIKLKEVKGWALEDGCFKQSPWFPIIISQQGCVKPFLYGVPVSMVSFFMQLGKGNRENQLLSTISLG